MRFRRETLEVIAILVIAGIILGGVVVAYPFIQRSDSDEGCSGDSCKIPMENSSNLKTQPAKALVLEPMLNTPDL